MLEFDPITAECLPQLIPVLRSDGSRSADYNGNTYLWSDYFNTTYCFFRGMVLMRYVIDGAVSFSCPVGKGPFREAVEALHERADFEGVPFVIMHTTECKRELLEYFFPGRFRYVPNPDNSDYIYSAEKLAGFPGKALHGKRNHCNRFRSEHDWHFDELTPELFPECMDLFDRWLEDNSERLEDSISFERSAILRAWESRDILGVEGGVLFADGRMVGFTMGEPACPDTFDVHFEKADPSINGAYPMVCSEFVQMLRKKHPGIAFINREEDMGIEALRISKQSYHPEYILGKSDAIWTE